MFRSDVDFYVVIFLGKNMEKDRNVRGWLAIALSTITVMSAIIGSKLDGFTWILYPCAPILVVSFGVLVWDRFVGARFERYRSKRCAIKLLKKYYGRYSNVVEKFSLLEEMEKSLGSDKIEWSNDRPVLLRSVQNSLYSIKYGLAHIPSEYRLIALNIALGEIVRPFDSWLKIYDFKLKNGEARYQTEEAQNNIIVLIQKFSEITLVHDDLCKEINSKLNFENLEVVGYFCQNHAFNWKRSEPEPK